MDGIDISLVQTNGLELINLNENYFYEYNKNTKNKLKNILKKDISSILKRKNYLNKFVTNEHYLALKKLNILDKCDLIGFHGQTIYHQAETKTSIQLGDPQLLSQKVKKNVVFDFRSNDLIFGGQGAPLAPVYHKFIIKKLNLELPSCIINIGGVSNLTYWDGNKLIGFDTGPGNALMDDYMSLVLNKNFDKNGYIASKGNAIKNEIKKILEHDFFKKLPPKSLDRLSFYGPFQNLIQKDYSVCDIMATLAELTVESIVISLEHLPKTINTILVTGGGYKNIHLMNRLKDRLKAKFFNQKQLGIRSDFIEAELIAYLTARSIYKLPFTYPSTTGVSKPTSGGKLYNNL